MTQSHPILGSPRRPHPPWKPFAVRQPGSRACIKTAGNHPEDPRRTSRNPEMQTQSQNLSVVAWTLQADRRSSENVFTLCQREHSRKEPLMPSALPDYPWQKIGSDLFLLNGKTYLIAIDYFSRYPEVVTLSSVTSQSVITALKSLFARYGIP